MSKQLIAVLALALSVAVAGWALAQPKPEAPPQAGNEVGRFAVTPMGTTAVLLDTATGKTWVLHDSADRPNHIWVPAERIDDTKEGRAWLSQQAAIKEARKAR